MNKLVIVLAMLVFILWSSLTAVETDNKKWVKIDLLNSYSLELPPNLKYTKSDFSKENLTTQIIEVEKIFYFEFHISDAIYSKHSEDLNNMKELYSSVNVKTKDISINNIKNGLYFFSDEIGEVYAFSYFFYDQKLRKSCFFSIHLVNITSENVQNNQDVFDLGKKILYTLKKN
jgi:hypothetical protein